MKKDKILIASVLKPVNEPRMYARMGKSLQAAGFDVHLFGAGGFGTNNNAGIHFYGKGLIKRFSIQRLLMPWRMIKLVTKVKPDILIVNTHELLIVTYLCRILFGCKLIYDIQENYFRNIWYTYTFPPLIKHFLAIWVRTKEYLLSRFFQHILLAEASYLKEMKFLNGLPHITVENKLAFSAEVPRRKIVGNNVQLLFTGTLAESTGVFTAIELAKKLHRAHNAIRLTIAGFCTQSITLQKLRESIHGQHFIKLICGDTPLEHDRIIELILNSDFGIIAYPDNPSTSGAMPSKLYEYLGLKLPFLYLDNAQWTDLVQDKSAGLAFNSDSDANQLLKQMRNTTFYTSDTKDALWSSESSKLIALINKII